jgi:hypothetical protein
MIERDEYHKYTSIFRVESHNLIEPPERGLIVVPHPRIRETPLATENVGDNPAIHVR